MIFHPIKKNLLYHKSFFRVFSNIAHFVDLFFFPSNNKKFDKNRLHINIFLVFHVDYQLKNSKYD